MSLNYLYSIMLELSPTTNSTLPTTMGHQGHALFLDLIHKIDPILAARLHDEPNYRPFTISSLKGARERDHQLQLEAGKVYRLRITLLDGGTIWKCLSDHILEARPNTLILNQTSFTLERVILTASSDSTGWVDYTDWQTLANTPAQRIITLCFDSPTAFSLGDRRFALFPDPILLWDSLMRTWNLYAPACLHLDKQHIRNFVKDNIIIDDYDLHTITLHYPKYKQKGFVGTCSYQLKTTDSYATQIATLARFAQYAGVGYKTTMGMGQTRLCDPDNNMREARLRILHAQPLATSCEHKCDHKGVD